MPFVVVKIVKPHGRWGPSLRKRCPVLLNTDLLLDLGPDLMAAAQQHGVSLAQIMWWPMMG